MKHFFMGSGVLTLLFLFAGQTYAAPTNPQKADNNPQIVANYQTGQHTVIENPNSIDYNHNGADVVMKAGNSGTFQQWFVGSSSTEPSDGTHGDHSVWRDIGQQTSCPSGWTFVQNPNNPPTGATWGTYFSSGDNYCVHTNDSQLGN